MADNRKLLDMRGRACPEPVIETRKALEARSVTAIEVLVDNDAAAGNVSRTARNLGCEVTVESTIEGEFKVIVERGASDPERIVQPDDASACCCDSQKPVILFSRETFGSGDPDLGKALLKAFMGVLGKLPRKPSTLIFLNDGAKLVCDETPFVDHVKALEAEGVSVLVCGTCLDFYHLEKRLRVGTVSNMLDIATVLTEADSIIQP